MCGSLKLAVKLALWPYYLYRWLEDDILEEDDWCLFCLRCMFDLHETKGTG